MNDEKLEELLRMGAKRAADGVVFTLPDGGTFHVWDIHPQALLDSVEPSEHRFLAFCSVTEIFRMRSIRNPYDYLLRLRAEAISAEPRSVRVMMARKKSFVKSGRVWSLSSYYHGFDYYQKSYVQNMSRREGKLLKKMPSGMLLTREVNAACIRSFVGDVVVCSEALQHFYYYMTMGLCAPNIGVAEEDAVNALLIGVRVMHGSEALDFDIDSRGVLPMEIDRKISECVMHQMQFTFGHEYSHYICDHIPGAIEISAGSDMAYGNDAAIDPDSAKNFSYEAEFEADLYAVKAVGANVQSQRSLTEGAFFALLAVHFFEGFSEMISVRKKSISATHPRAIDRIWRLWGDLRSDLRPTRQWVNDCLEAVEQMKVVLVGHIENYPESDLLNFYGSIYLPSYKEKKNKDRIDF